MACAEHFRARAPAAAPVSSETAQLLFVDSVQALCDTSASLSLAVSGSKSFTNRAIVLAALSQSPLLLRGALFSDDSFWGFDCLLRLGAELAFDWEGGEVEVLSWSGTLRSGQMHLGMAGTLARFFPAVILNRGPVGEVVQLGAHKRLCERPLTPLIQALRALGAQINGDSLPLSLQRSPLGGETEISGAQSGQFLSGLVLTACSAPQPVRVFRRDNLVQPDYVRMTVQAARAFGADITVDDSLTELSCRPVAQLAAAQRVYTVEADASTACYYFALAVLLNLDLEVTNLGSSTLQPDLKFVSFLERLGARFEVTQERVRHIRQETASLLRGGFTADFTAMSDQALTAGVMALFADGPIVITGVAHIRKHESDRVACFCANLTALGIPVTERADGFELQPLGNSRPSGRWPTHHDHRFAMCGFLLACRLPNLGVAEAWCCEKTAPGFFEHMQQLGVQFSAR